MKLRHINFLFRLMSLFNIPNILTAFNLICGIFSIILSLSGRVDLAVYPVFGSLFFDYLDGFAARLLKQQGEIGKQLDSLADVISFGLVPGIWMLVILPSVLATDIISFNPYEVYYYFTMWLSAVMNGETSNYLPFIALLIPVFSMFRLAKFNIDERQTTSFIGLPTPANTLFFSLFPLLLFTVEKNAVALSFIQFFFQPAVIVICILVFSFLLIAELPLFSLKFKQLSFRGNEVRYLFLLAVLISIVVLKFLAIPIIIVLYLVFSVIENKFVKN